MQRENVIGDFRITPLSDRSVLVSFGNTIDRAINETVLFLHKALLLSSFEGFIESVPAYASLAVFYDVSRVRMYARTTAFEFVKEFLQHFLQQRNSGNQGTGKMMKIPVCYDTEFGIDLEEVARYQRLRTDEISKLHAAVTYRVYMIGFMPGFPYMGVVDNRLITPRKDRPRLYVPEGSVGIAGAQTGIYPVGSPGGWQIIGRTPLRLFDSSRSTPCLLSAGDNVQFISIDKNEFENYKWQ